jgi:hypothetical protein
MKEMEREAYETGNMCFRDWEEKYRGNLQESKHYYLGDTKMNIKEWKNHALFGRLMENFGYGDGPGIESEEEDIEVEEVSGITGECGGVEDDVSSELYETDVRAMVREVLKKYSIKD